ncbi:uracil-DNA glycosylase family protein [uncultured Sanguibacteroides sp.]|uniref:uracil-DNA glycosylase family protein n=1 Tax=uncultured Sanguibacteroides sp. TaxID=1635151 RepID=UPI0025F11010|nr:uracil-DNA glycosylase family protein [uncultured Sanguibacteroides sp.]
MIDNNKAIEIHPLEPFLPEGARLLMLGSFPPPRSRWSMDFYYPNFQNDMWRILGIVFFRDKNYFLTEDGKRFQEEKIRAFLMEKGIALSDTAMKVIRHKDNASDKFLEVVESVDLEVILQRLSLCRAIVTTGQKATDTLIALTGTDQPPVGGFSAFYFQGREIRLYRMPSSSRAYPKPVEEKALYYQKMMEDIGLLNKGKE